MDLGISGKKALLCASSRGLGKACALALAHEGVDVTINGLTEDRLEAAAREIRDATEVTVTAVQADQTTEEGRAKLLAACADADILVNNNAGPPPRDFMECSHDDYIQAIEMNMLAGTMMIRGVLDHMREQKFGRIVNIISAMVKHPFQYMGLSTSARSGLTALCKALSLQVARDNVTLNNLLPERIDTDRQIFMAENRAKTEGIFSRFRDLLEFELWSLSLALLCLLLFWECRGRGGAWATGENVNAPCGAGARGRAASPRGVAVIGYLEGAGADEGSGG